jgi:hypothetical protein
MADVERGTNAVHGMHEMSADVLQAACRIGGAGRELQGCA